MATAAALSAGIGVSDGAELVNAVRFYTSPPGPTFVPGLDSTLLDHDQLAVLDANSTLTRGEVIELQGGPSTGKTELLIFLAITTVLPFTWSVELKSTTSTRPAQTVDIELSMRGQSVVYFDCEGTLRVERIAEGIRAFLHRRIREHCDKTPSLYNGQPTSATAVDDEVDRALSRIHIYRPSSTISLAATLTTLPDRLLSLDGPDVELGMILIDGISSYHWQDALTLERDTSATTVHPLRHVVNALSTIRHSLGPVVVVSNWGLSTSSTAPNKQFYRQHLHAPWPDPFSPIETSAGIRIEPSLHQEFDPRHPITRSLPISTHITLFKVPVMPFDHGTTLQDALHGQLGQNREAKRQDSGYYGLVRKPGVNEGQAVGRFTYHVGATGIEF